MKAYVGGDCYRTNNRHKEKLKSYFEYCIEDAMAYPKGISIGIAPYGMMVK